jgi:hypothetical protein
MRARRGSPDIAGPKIFVPDAVPIGSGGAHMEQHAMLKPMPSDFADPAESSTETVARALAALTPSDLLRLKRVAQLRARLIPGLEWDELLNEALLRALDGSRRWPEGVPLLALGHGPPRDDRGYVFAILTLILRTLGCAKC